MAGNLDNEHARRRNRWSLAIWGGAASLLMLPAVAMQFTDEVNWTAGDFVVMGAMLAVACGSYEVVARISSNRWYRIAAGIAIVTAFVTLWVNLAVGMLGSEDNPDNLLFGGVLAVGMIGAVIAWFRPQAMARAMAATAVAQVAMTVYALTGGYAEVVLHVGAFVIPWAVSARLFGKAAREHAEAGNSA